MCGEGVTMRTRHFLNRMGFKKCSHVDTVEKEACTGIKGQCMDSGVENEGVSNDNNTKKYNIYIVIILVSRNYVE
jgi:hypothetical protein